MIMRKILAVARLELTRSKSEMNRRLMLCLGLVIFTAALALPQLDLADFSMNREMYLIKVDGPPMDIVLGSDERFRLVDEAPFDLEIKNGIIKKGDSQRSQAALSAVYETAALYRENMLRQKYPVDSPDYFSAFPVWVEVTYLDSLPEAPPAGNEVAPRMTPQPAAGNASSPVSVPSVQNETRISPANVPGTPPGDIKPPFPLTSVLVSFFFVSPMFFVSQIYSSGLMDERISRKGVMLLVSPVKGYEIVIGKTLPYFCLLLLYVIIASVLLDGSVLAVLLIVPVILIFLSTAFIASIMARNFRELTVMLVFFAVVLGSYLFIPTAFINLHEYSIISPLTLVVSLLEGDVVTMDIAVFASAPLLFVSLLTYMFGTLLMHEEGLLVKTDMFEKVLDSVDRLLYYLRGRNTGVLAAGILAVPFVFLTQLFLLVIFFNVLTVMPLPVIGISILVSVMVEEWAKSLAPRVLLGQGSKNPVMLGILSGTGYFLGEKALLLLTLSAVVEGGLGRILFAGSGYLLAVPLIIHVSGAVVSSWGMAAGIRPANAVCLASMLHFMINIIIFWRSGLFG